ncbi:hypothetical protein HMPREF9412_3037 [Paenibacillus sp. HGF5]|nr:hypothetical protein HMPREF9412_3037 [Paenibacillus sp. HGF5]
MDKLTIILVKFLTVVIFILLFIGVFLLGRFVGNATPWYVTTSLLILLIVRWVYLRIKNNH